MMSKVYKVQKLIKDLNYKIHNFFNSNDNSSNVTEVNQMKDLIEKIDALIDFGEFYVDRSNTGGDCNMYKTKYNEYKKQYIQQLQEYSQKLIDKLNKVSNIDNSELS